VGRPRQGADDGLSHRDDILPQIAEYSPYEQLSADDPPIYLFYGCEATMGQEVKDPVHTTNFGIGFQTKCREISVECQLTYPRATDVKHPHPVAFLIEKLKNR
jgi:hypothetical protein